MGMSHDGEHQRMTKATFEQRHKAYARHLEHLWGIPWGIFFAVQTLLIPMWTIYLLFLLYYHHDGDALAVILGQLAGCGIVIAASIIGERAWRRRCCAFEAELSCPHCGKYLELEVSAKDACPHCGKDAFEGGDK
jgi:hypothetical protein